MVNTIRFAFACFVLLWVVSTIVYITSVALQKMSEQSNFVEVKQVANSSINALNYTKKLSEDAVDIAKVINNIKQNK